MAGDSATHRRPRGRPPKSDGLATSDLLIEAAGIVCAEHGFDGTTLSMIAERAGVHSTAIYNHFADREDLLYAAAVKALDEITRVVDRFSDGFRSFHSIPHAYLRPSMARQRRLLAEIHLASTRDQRMSSLLATWHRRWTDTVLDYIPSDVDDPHATVKAIYLLLLGLCHVDNLPAVNASRRAVAELTETMIRAIVPDEPAT